MQECTLEWMIWIGLPAVLGLLGLVAAGCSARPSDSRMVHATCLLTLAIVGCIAFCGVQSGSQNWLASGTWLALITVGATVDVRKNHPTAASRV